MYAIVLSIRAYFDLRVSLAILNYPFPCSLCGEQPNMVTFVGANVRYSTNDVRLRKKIALKRKYFTKKENILFKGKVEKCLVL